MLTLAESDRGLQGKVPIRLDALAGRVIDQHEEQAARHQLTLRRALAAATITGDPVLLERLIVNLIDNAIKYNEPGGWVEIEVTPGTGRSGRNARRPQHRRARPRGGGAGPVRAVPPPRRRPRQGARRRRPRPRDRPLDRHGSSGGPPGPPPPGRRPGNCDRRTVQIRGSCAGGLPAAPAGALVAEVVSSTRSPSDGRPCAGSARRGRSRPPGSARPNGRDLRCAGCCPTR